MAPIYRSHASEPRLPSISSLIREKGTQVGSCAWPILLWQKKWMTCHIFFFKKSKWYVVFLPSFWSPERWLENTTGGSKFYFSTYFHLKIHNKYHYHVNKLISHFKTPLNRSKKHKIKLEKKISFNHDLFFL
jgi:hypothetical protein